MTPNGPAIKALVGMTKDKSHKIKVKKSKSCLARFTRCHARPARQSLRSLNERSMARLQYRHYKSVLGAGINCKKCYKSNDLYCPCWQ